MTIQDHARIVAALTDLLEDVLAASNADVRIDIDALTSLLMRRLAFLRQRALDGAVSTESLTVSVDKTIHRHDLAFRLQHLLGDAAGQPGPGRHPEAAVGLPGRRAAQAGVLTPMSRRRRSQDTLAAAPPVPDTVSVSFPLPRLIFEALVDRAARSHGGDIAAAAARILQLELGQRAIEGAKWGRERWRNVSYRERQAAMSAAAKALWASRPPCRQCQRKKATVRNHAGDYTVCRGCAKALHAKLAERRRTS